MTTPDAHAAPMSSAPIPSPPRRSRWRLIPFVHEGAGPRFALLCLGLALWLLALPPGPLPMAILAADAPLIWLIFAGGGRRWKRWSLLYGFAFFALTLRWLAHVHPAEVPLAALVMCPTTLIMAWLIRMVVRMRVPFVLGVGLVCVADEMLRTLWCGGMPWPMRSLAFASSAPLGASMHGLVPGGGLVGAYGLSFLAGATSAWIAGVPAWWGSLGEAKTRRMRVLLLSALVPIGATLVLGIASVIETRRHDAGDDTFETTDDVVVVQAAIPQALKADPSIHSGRAMFRQHVELTAEALTVARGGAQDEGRAILAVLWPETMITDPRLVGDLPARFPVAWNDELLIAERLRDDALLSQPIDMFVGLIARVPFDDGEPRGALSDYPQRDSMVHIKPWLVPPEPTTVRPPFEGTGRPPWMSGRHDKVRLVPGGEYTPMGDVFPFLRSIRNMVSSIPELEPGAKRQKPFRLVSGPPWHEGPKPEGVREIGVGSAICFDMAFPARCRTWRQDGAQVLLNPANYAWFGPSDFRAQVLAMARLRAAESGTNIVMAGNTGPSLFVDPVGRPYGSFVAAASERAGAEAVLVDATRVETTYRKGYAIAPLRIDRAVRAYVRWGDLPWAALAAAALGIGALRRRRRGRGSRSVYDAN